MRFEEAELRECSELYNMPEEPANKTILANHLMAPYRFVMIMGLSSTGKSTFLDAYTGRKGWGLTKWNRDNVMDMVFQDGTRVDKFYGYLAEFEGRLFDKLFVRERHQVVVEGWNTLPRLRRRYLNYMPETIGRSAIFVFDGPVEEIIKRNVASNKINLSRQELPLFLKNRYNSIVWPTFSEGWNDIYYINTFGARGTTYLKDKLE